MDELLSQFLSEGPDLVQQGAEALLALERRPDDRAMIDDAFRAIHTLKGSVGLFDLPDMAMVLHAAEDVLGAVREGRRAIDPAAIDDLLAALSHTERSLAALETSGAPPPDEADLAERLTARLRGEARAPAAVAVQRKETDGALAPPWAEALQRNLPPTAPSGALVALRYVPDPDCFFRGDDPMAILAAAPDLIHLQLGLAPAADEATAFDPFTCRLILEAVFSADLEAVKAAFRFAPDQVAFAIIQAASPLEPVEARREASARTLRIDAERLEDLARLVDELVTAKTSLAALAAQAAAGASGQAVADGLAVQAGAIDRLVGQAYGRVMALRTIPIGPLLRRFPRLVREMAASLDKSVELVVDDGGVEADKGIVEGLFEPLTHLLRNAVDHGVESTEVRRAQGKPAKAVITLTARGAGGRLNIRLDDDGRGLDPAAIRARAAERGLADAATLQALDDKATVDLIFLPGFSTATTVTALSGRGVGMDAVRTAVHRLGGRITLSSTLGAGTRIDLTLPLSVTLTKVMVVESAGERYGVPMDRIAETLRVPAARIAAIRAGHAFDWRDRTVPLMSLSSLVGGPTSLGDGDLRVLVIQAGAAFIGLAIDAVDDRLDLAVRPLDGLLAGMPGVTGAAMLGDGRVLMVLDPEGLAP